MHVLCQQKVKSHCLVSLSSIFPFCCERESVSGSIMTDSLQLPGPQPARLLCPWNSPGKNTGVHCPFLLQGIFLTQGSNLGLLHCRQILYCLNHQGILFSSIYQANKDLSLPIFGTLLPILLVINQDGNMCVLQSFSVSSFRAIIKVQYLPHLTWSIEPQ